MGSDREESGHEWTAAVYVKVSGGQLDQAVDRGRMSIRPGTIVDVQDLLCAKCRRPYYQVFDRACAADVDNTHLIGGHSGERAKRAHRDHDCFALGCNTAEVVAAQQQAARQRAGQGGPGR